MALQRPVVFVVVIAALDCGLAACSGPPAPPPAVADALTAGDVKELGKEVAALREQQIHLLDELRGVKAELSELAAVARHADEAQSPPPRAAPVEASALVIDPAPATEAAADEAPAPPAAAESSPASSYVAVAKRLIDDEDYSTAVRVMNVAAEVDPDFDEIYFERGVAKHLLQSFADAIDDFQAAIQRTGRQDLRYICLYNQACALARLGRKEEAIGKLVQSDEAGFRDLLEQMTTDPDLDSLRDLPPFREFVMMLRTR